MLGRMPTDLPPPEQRPARAERRDPTGPERLAGPVGPDTVTDDVERRLTIVMVADVPAADVRAFQEYESLVLPLLARHAGRLDRRLRNADGTVEVHIVSFDSRAGYESYMADPERLTHRDRLSGAHVDQRVVEVRDVCG